MRMAIQRGIAVADFESMTIGMIIDYLVSCSNAEYLARYPERIATQADIDAF